MRLAFAIFRYFPFGGLQRDLFAIVQEAVARHHQVTLFCGEWQGEKPENIDVVELLEREFGDRAGVKSFVRAFQSIYQRNNFDLLIGFNKMPGLDVYFAGDSCFAQKTYEERHYLYRFAPRTRLYLDYEKAVFGERSNTKILSITDTEKKHFARYYSTASERFYALPPGIAPSQYECRNPQAAREKIRAELQIPLHAKVVLCLGSGFKTKGLDRSIDAFALLRDRLQEPPFLLVVGADNAKPYRYQAEQLGVIEHVKFLGGRKDIAEILQSVDVLLHPAYRELAGNVLLEAMLAGKPVVATSVCGFSHYVTEQKMGVVISGEKNTISPGLIAQQTYNVLQVAPEVWQERAKNFAATTDVFSRAQHALDVVENIVQKNQMISREWISDSKEQIIILRDELASVLAKKDVFEFMSNISGSVARETTDRQTLRFELNGIAYYRKLHRGVGWKEIFKNLLQLRLPVVGAKNEWAALNKLLALGIPTLEPVAYGEQKTNPATRLSFIVTRELTNVIQLDHYFQQVKVGFREKTILLHKVAQLARAMHAAGINHRDFYLCHFMLDFASIAQWKDMKAEPKIYVVDLHRAQIRHEVPGRWLIKDLSGLYYSSLDLGFKSNDYFRFMCAYWQLPLRQIFDQKNNLLIDIAARAVKTYQRDFKLIPKLPVKLLVKES